MKVPNVRCEHNARITRIPGPHYVNCGAKQLAHFAMNALVARLQDRTSFASDDQADYAEELAQELVALQSIYGNEQVELKSGAKVREPITFQVQLPCEDMGHNVCIKFQIQLPIGTQTVMSHLKLSL